MKRIFPGWRGRTVAEVKALIGRVAAAAAFRWGCFATMIWLGLHAERRAAPRVPDLIIDGIRYIPWVNHWNYFLWLAAYIPGSIVLLGIDPKRTIRFMVTGGIISLLRGACVLLTGLGALSGEDAYGPRLTDAETFREAFFSLINPIAVFFDNSANIYLTKDLFFSGHVATTFLLILYAWPYRAFRNVLLVLHVLVVLSLFFGHIHYSIDVVGAYAITFAVFVLREGNVRAMLYRR
jgi:hypothetical protein